MEIKSFKKHLLQKGVKIIDALKQLNFLGKDAIVFIVDENGLLVGSLTDGDIRRALLKGFDTTDIVDEIIQPNPQFLIKDNFDIDYLLKLKVDNFKIIPILNEERRVINVINFNEVKSYLPFSVIIMAGGRGERLRPYTDLVPKPMLLIGNKPIIEYNVNSLKSYGVENFWISVNYLGEQIENYFGNGSAFNLNINYIYEKKALGTIGSASNIGEISHEFVLIMNSDILQNVDFEKFFIDFQHQDADLSILTIPYKVDIPFAVLETENRQVVSLQEKPTFTYFSNGGIYLLKKSVLNLIPKDQQFHATDLIETMVNQKMKVISYPFVGYWLDIGRKSDFEKAKVDIVEMDSIFGQ